MKHVTAALSVCIGTLIHAQEAAPNEPLSLDQLQEQFNWDFDKAEITTQKVGDGLHVLFGLGGNIAASIGEDGVLIVDDMFPQMIPKIEATIQRLGGHGIDFVVNTHWHFDHAEGNRVLGPAGTWIVAHENSAAMMAKTNVLNLVATRYRQEAYPSAARPDIAFDDRMRLYFNGDEIDIVHTGPAHTAGDAAVIFRNRNVVHFGDVFNNTGYPFIDADSGGSIDGMIAFCQSILDEVGADAVIVPGHGAVTDSATVQRYIDMLKIVRGRVAEQIAQGKSLAEVVAAQPTADFDATYGAESQSPGFVNRVYASLMRAAAP